MRLAWIIVSSLDKVKKVAYNEYYVCEPRQC